LLSARQEPSVSNGKKQWVLALRGGVKTPLSDWIRWWVLQFFLIPFFLYSLFKEQDLLEKMHVSGQLPDFWGIKNGERILKILKSSFSGVFCY
jgi:hypothetical protein